MIRIMLFVTYGTSNPFAHLSMRLTADLLTTNRPWKLDVSLLSMMSRRPQKDDIDFRSKQANIVVNRPQRRFTKGHRLALFNI